MRILFLGDVSGRSGREAVKEHLPALKKAFAPDATLINVENSASGFGVTLKLAHEFLAEGADCLTTGNHIWDQKEMVCQIDQEPRLLRPLNFQEGTPGKGAYLLTLPDKRTLLVINAIGRLFMKPFQDDPFTGIDALLRTHPMGSKATAIFVDFHAEATSEKMALGHYLDGRVSAVVGTHTHIPTADAQILPKGTAYQTDAGMCGDYNSVIGVKAETSVPRYTRAYPGERMVVAEGEATVCGTFIETNDQTGLAQTILPVRIGGRLQQTPL